jgi:hypothetical protein
MHQLRINKWTTIILGAALLAGIVPDLSAAQKSASEIVQEQQDLLFRECKPTDAQQTTIKEKLKLKQEALEKWEKDNADKLKAAEEAAKAARQGTDASAKKQAADTLKGLTTSRTQVIDQTDKPILDALTEEQRLTWAGVQMAQTMLPRFKKANLTDEQTAKIKSACLAAAKDLASYTGDDKKDKQGRTTIQKSLQWAIDNVILTAEQRETMGRKPSAKAAK